MIDKEKDQTVEGFRRLLRESGFQNIGPDDDVLQNSA